MSGLLVTVTGPQTVPEAQTITPGQNAVFSVAASGTPNVGYASLCKLGLGRTARWIEASGFSVGDLCVGCIQWQCLVLNAIANSYASALEFLALDRAGGQRPQLVRSRASGFFPHECIAIACEQHTGVDIAKLLWTLDGGRAFTREETPASKTWTFMTLAVTRNDTASAAWVAEIYDLFSGDAILQCVLFDECYRWKLNGQLGPTIIRNLVALTANWVAQHPGRDHARALELIDYLNEKIARAT